MKNAAFDETTQRVHDYRNLIARWRGIARESGLKLEVFARAGQYPVYCLHTRERSDGGLYLSAGIHGDEPAGAEGLVRWAQTHLPTLARLGKSMPLLILPCLNPWGLVNNQRADEHGNDLNRVFHRNDLAPVAQLKTLLKGRRFAMALHLHEDYDGQGVYLYEIRHGDPGWGSGLLKACRTALPIDQRARIDRRPFKDGVALLPANVMRIRLHPEALHLYFKHCPHVVTFETPSEFALSRRVQAHVLFVEECMRRLLRDKAAG